MSCNNCGRHPCSCVGTPYYLDACVQDHTLKTYQPQYSFGLCPQSQWNVPLCGGSAVLSIPGVIGVPTGANIWHPQFGYFKIIAVDSIAGTITITNDCPQVEYQASPGTQIPGCTCFAIVPLPYDEQGPDTQVCVAVSFTAPAEDNPTDITLTSVAGIEVGDTIQIGTGFYYVSEIKSNNVVTIINQGEGILPGTAVIAQDVNGNYLNCIQIIQTSPCLRPDVEQGNFLGCDENGIVGPLKVCNNTAIEQGFIVACNEEGVGPLIETTFGGSIEQDDSDSLTIPAGGAINVTTTVATVVLTNNSPTRTMLALVTYIFSLNNQIGAGSPTTSTQADIERQVDGGGYSSVVPVSLFRDIAASLQDATQVVATSVETILPSGSKTIDARGRYLAAGDSDGGSGRLQVKAICISIA